MSSPAATLPPSDGQPQAPDLKLAELERQIEQGHLFAHTALGQGFARIGETTAFLFGLLDILLAKGLIDRQELESGVQRVRQEMAEQGELSGPGTAIRVDSEEESARQATPVNCQERIHICQAVCCKLNFALSIPEVEAGEVKWELGRPYLIRHRADGYCVHNDRHTGGCSVYHRRPAICQRYSCANDSRIWTAFDAMVLNTSWIEAHLSATSQPRLVGTLMHGPT